MTPHKLKLVNFSGILVGLGKQEVEIDFDHLVPSDAQVVALVGDNGAGKTTILDNMQPFRLMPSRASTLSPEGFSYYDHVQAEADALKELEWSDKGRRFRSVIRIRSTRKTRKQECYLLELDGEGNTNPFRGRDGLVSNGSTESYDRSVEEVLGAPEVFFTAQFGAQGRKPLASMRVGEIKTLLSAMLRFDRYADAHSKAKSVCDAIKGSLVSLQRSRQEQATFLEETRQEAQAIPLLVQHMDRVNERLDQQARSVVEAEREHAVIQERLQQQAAARLRHTSVRSRLDAARQHAAQLGDVFDRETDALRQSFSASALNASKTEQMARQAVGDAKRRLDEATQLTVKKGAIEAAEKKIVALRERLGRLRMKRDELGFKPSIMADLRESLGRMREKLMGDNADAKSLAALIETMRHTASIVGEVPCMGTDLAGGCKLLAKGIQAAEELPLANTRLATLNESRATIRIKGTQDAARLKELEEAESQDRTLTQQISDIELEIANLKSVLSERDRAQAAEMQLPNLQQAMLVAQTVLHEASQAVLAETTRSSQWEIQRSEARERQLASAMQSVKALEQELSALPPLVDAIDVSAAERKIEAERAVLSELGLTRASLETKLRSAESAAKRVAEFEEATKLLDRREQAYSDALALWSLLQLALSKNGILSMELDDANPAIAAHTNALLDECYGGRFSVRLETQKATAAGVNKEDFKVLVTDNFRGGDAKSLDLMSGGEKVWINECLVRGIALYTSALEGRSGGVLFSDETDGPLDEGRKRQFMAMKRACLRIGGYDRDYVITHTPGLWNMCDARIDVSLL